MVTDLPNYKIQFDWLKRNISEVGCQKTVVADVAEKLKPVYNAAIIRRKIICILWFKFSSKVFAEQRQKWATILSSTRTNLKGIQVNTSSSNMYVSSIDHGATRLGGYSSVYVCRWEAPFFSKLYCYRRVRRKPRKSVSVLSLKTIKASQGSRFEDVPVLFV